MLLVTSSLLSRPLHLFSSFPHFIVITISPKIATRKKTIKLVVQTRSLPRYGEVIKIRCMAVIKISARCAWVEEEMNFTNLARNAAWPKKHENINKIIAQSKCCRKSFETVAFHWSDGIEKKFFLQTFKQISIFFLCLLICIHELLIQLVWTLTCINRRIPQLSSFPDSRSISRRSPRQLSFLWRSTEK